MLPCIEKFRDGHSIQICYSILLNEIICIVKRRRKKKFIALNIANSTQKLKQNVTKQILLKNRLLIRISPCLGMPYFKLANCQQSL